MLKRIWPALVYMFTGKSEFFIARNYRQAPAVAAEYALKTLTNIELKRYEQIEMDMHFVLHNFAEVYPVILPSIPSRLHLRKYLEIRRNLQKDSKKPSG